MEAHRIMSISLGKIYNSRVQRGGIKLHKNLLVSLVLRSARQVYLSDYYGGMCLNAQQMGEREWVERETLDSERDKLVPEATNYSPSSLDGSQGGFSLPLEQQTAEMVDTTAQPQIQVTSPVGERGSTDEKASQLDCNIECQATQDADVNIVSTNVNSDTSNCEAPVSSPVPARCANTQRSKDHISVAEESRGEYEASSPSGCVEAGGDLDSQEPNSHQPTAPVSCCTRKRSAEKSPQTASPVKKAKVTASTTADSHANSNEDRTEEMDTSNVSSLITIFGSSFSGLLTKDGAQPESESEDGDSGAGQICCDQMLKNLNPWSTAIVAF